MVDFTSLMASFSKTGDNAWSVIATDDWLQGRTIYGGLAAALCLEAAERAFSGLPPLRSAQFSFVGPAAGTLNIHPTMLRKGKSTTFVGVDLSGEAGLATRAILCFGAARVSSMRFETDMAKPVITPPETSPDFFRQAQSLLNFAQQFDGRLAAGSLPLSGGPEPTLTMWLRHRDEHARGSVKALVALADAPPPASMVQFKIFAPISTMTWSIDFLTDRLETTDGWWLVRSSAENVADGYSSQAMTVWNAAGVPVMVSRQNVAVFA